MKKMIPLCRVALAILAPLLYLPSSSVAQSKATDQKNISQAKQTNLPKAASTNWIDAAQENITRSSYFFKQEKDEILGLNQKQKIAFEVTGTKLITVPVSAKKKWSSAIELTQIDKGAGGIIRAEVPAITNDNGHLVYAYQNFNIEYLNSEAGLRQNFIVTKRPAGTAQLKVHLKISGDLEPQVSSNTFLKLLDKQTRQPFLKYDDLKVWDANNKLLAAHMEMGGDNELQLIINDAGAVYPVTVDPLTHSYEWMTSADGILSGLLPSLQIDALYGYNVTGVGDVNGDGYDDVAIGAPTAADVISGPVTLASVGAVFVFFGSDTGLSKTPNRILRGNTAIANALFGFSVAGGNFTGTSKSDIVVGAPGETYSANVSGFPVTATVTAGKVYGFSGDDLAAGTMTPLLSVYLDGSDFFSRGILGLLASNVNTNALFGFSVAVTDDMGTDGLGEIVVGAPGYLGVNLLDVRSGAAFVYYSTNIGTNTPVQLSAPGLLGFPGLINLDGLLFGFSVDGAGDYDKDTHPDIVVGAPGGLNLGLAGLLGGSAYVYGGTGTGVSTTIKTQLTASGPLLGSVANLFGYKVKGVKGINGLRNGNILIGAPAGNVLSNVLGGLRLQAGTINVFTAKASPAATETQVQAFSSPRATNLLSLLALQNQNIVALFGASMDNVFDANCDGIPDIIVGEPLNTGIGLIGVNAIGGAAYVFTGDGTGKYNTTPYWTLENKVSFDAGINAGSLIGYSVAGAGHTNGPLKSVRAIVGAPGKALDFSSGILNLGNTLGTLLNLAAGDNGIGKAYAFGFNCDVLIAADYNVTHVNVTVPGNVNTNDIVPGGTTYGVPVANAGNIPGATINMSTDGSYTFVAPTPGVYIYNVPVCMPAQACIPSRLTITVLSANNAVVKPPVANTDLATAFSHTAVVIKTLVNDAAGDIGKSLTPASVTVTIAPLHGNATVNSVTGDITYTSTVGYTGLDTLTYRVSDNNSTPQIATAIQIIFVKAIEAANSTAAADDYVRTAQNTAVMGNVKANDTDPEGDNQVITAQSITVPGKGTLSLSTNGSFTFTPQAGYVGPVSFRYVTTDDGAPQASSAATLYILVSTLSVLPINIESFSTTNIDCDANIQWKLGSESNVDHTEVQQSMDGINFSSVYTQNGNASASSDHAARVIQSSKLAYYRLRIVANDGGIIYSEIKNVKTTCGIVFQKLAVLPNIITNTANVVFTTDEQKGLSNVTVQDVYGRVLLRTTININQGVNKISLNTSVLPTDTYYIRITGNDWRSETVKIIKE